MSSEADLLTLMRANREVQNRRRNAQALKDEEATEETTSAAKSERFTRRRS